MRNMILKEMALYPMSEHGEANSKMVLPHPNVDMEKLTVRGLPHPNVDMEKLTVRGLPHPNVDMEKLTVRGLPHPNVDMEKLTVRGLPHPNVDCKQCKIWVLLIWKVNFAGTVMITRNEKEPIFAADVEKVVTRRTILLNETIAPVGGHEGIRGRNDGDIWIKNSVQLFRQGK